MVSKDFMARILANHLIANTLHAKKFLNEQNYSVSFRESSLTHISMFFRSEPKWKIVESMNDIGWS